MAKTIGKKIHVSFGDRMVRGFAYFFIAFIVLISAMPPPGTIPS